VSVRPVLQYPHPDLKRPAEPVGGVTHALRSLADDLVETMRASPATVGLAAPQIGEHFRLFALDVSGHRHATTAQGLVVLFDPEARVGQVTEIVREGCLSVPHLTADVRRAVKITLTGLAPDGGPRRYEMEGFEARAALHEVDHLDGMLILDRVDSSSDLFARKIYR
jgi:peptide deformylase